MIGNSYLKLKYCFVFILPLLFGLGMTPLSAQSATQKDENIAETMHNLGLKAVEYDKLKRQYDSLLNTKADKKLITLLQNKLDSLKNKVKQLANTIASTKNDNTTLQTSIQRLEQQASSGPYYVLMANQTWLSDNNFVRKVKEISGRVKPHVEVITIYSLEDSKKDIIVPSPFEIISNHKNSLSAYSKQGTTLRILDPKLFWNYDKVLILQVQD